MEEPIGVTGNTNGLTTDNSDVLSQWRELFKTNYQMQTCPSCGYCPHCGRGGAWTRPYTPWYPMPTYPLYPTYPSWTITSGTQVQTS